MFCNRQAIGIGPTPPGTGVIAPATSAASARIASGDIAARAGEAAAVLAPVLVSLPNALPPKVWEATVA